MWNLKNRTAKKYSNSLYLFAFLLKNLKWDTSAICRRIFMKLDLVNILSNCHNSDIINSLLNAFNHIPNGHGRNQPIYECHVTTAGRNRVKAYLTNLVTESLAITNASFCWIIPLCPPLQFPFQDESLF